MDLCIHLGKNGHRDALELHNGEGLKENVYSVNMNFVYCVQRGSVFYN